MSQMARCDFATSTRLTLLDLPVAQDSILVLGQRGQDRILGYEGIRFEFNKVKLERNRK